MKLTDILFESVKEIWNSYLEHPFVKGLSDGTLPLDKFRYYTIQDNLYLVDYSKVFALGIVKSKEQRDMQVFMHLMQGAFSGETKAHNEFLSGIGITEEIMKNAKPSLSNESYTKYMLAVSHDGGACEAAVAVLACGWSYKVIGDFAASQNGHEGTYFCKDWVDLYSSKEYADEIEENIQLVNRLGKDYTAEQIEQLKTIIINCSKYEYLFWEDSWNKGM